MLSLLAVIHGAAWRRCNFTTKWTWQMVGWWFRNPLLLEFIEKHKIEVFRISPSFGWWCIRRTSQNQPSIDASPLIYPTTHIYIYENAHTASTPTGKVCPSPATLLLLLLSPKGKRKRKKVVSIRPTHPHIQKIITHHYSFLVFFFPLRRGGGGGVKSRGGGRALADYYCAARTRPPPSP